MPDNPARGVTIIEKMAMQPKTPSGLNAAGMKCLLNAVGMKYL